MVLVFVGTLVGLLQGIGIVLGIAGGLLAVSSPVLAAWLIYRDAAIVASYETDWSPDPTKYAIATVLLGPTVLVPNLFTNALAPTIRALQSAYSGLAPTPEGLLISKFSLGLPLVAVYYLYQRNRYLGSAVIPSHRSWWVVLPVVTLVGLLSLPVVGVRPELGLVVHHGVGLLLAGIPSQLISTQPIFRHTRRNRSGIRIQPSICTSGISVSFTSRCPFSIRPTSSTTLSADYREDQDKSYSVVLSPRLIAGQFTK